MPRAALVAGGSGLVGGHLLGRLLADARWDRVVALGRRPLELEHPKLEQEVLDFGALPEAGVPTADDAFCCLGTTIKKAGSEAAFRRVDRDYAVAFARAAAEAGATQLLVVSSMGADPRSRIFYNRVKGEIEADVSALPFEAVQIARPALLLGERDEERLGEQVAQVAFRVATPLLVGPLRKLRPIKAEAVAAALVALAAERPAGVHVWESGGLAERAT